MATDLGGKKRGVACAHENYPHLPINDIIARIDTTKDMLNVLDTLALFQRHDKRNNYKAHNWYTLDWAL